MLAGSFNSSTERIRIEVSGCYSTLEDPPNLRLRVNNQDFRLADVAQIYRGYEYSPHDRISFKGKEAMLLGVSMKDGGVIIALGCALNQAMERIKLQLLVGLDLNAMTF